MKGWSSKKRALIIGLVSLLGMSAIGAAQPKEPTPAVPTNTTTEVKADSIELKTETTTESIPFSVQTINDPNLATGSDHTQTDGVNGVKTNTWEVTYTNGTETNRVLSKEVTTQPVTRVIVHGTKVALNCPNGTYINSAGNEVCSPYQASTTPSGATAQCRDGTYSFSQSRSGTCSHHGGVATWL